MDRWLSYLGDVRDSKETSRLMGRCVGGGHFAEVVTALDARFDGGAWLADTGYGGLGIVVRASMDDPVPVSSLYKDEDRLVAETVVALSPLVPLDGKQRAFTLFQHVLSVLAEVGRRKKLGPPPMRLSGLSEPTSLVKQQSPDAESPAAVLQGLSEMDFLVARSLPVRVKRRDVGKVVRQYGEQFEAVFGMSSDYHLVRDSSDAGHVSWIVPADPADPADPAVSRRSADRPARLPRNPGGQPGEMSR